jgi:uncharacterized protein with HEPN domain
MPHDEIIYDRLTLIAEGIQTIEVYSEGINSAEDFLKNTDTRKTLDVVMMRLQAIGENIKKIELLSPGFFAVQHSYDVTPIIRFRDFISHHYEKTDHEIIFEIISSEIPLFKERLSRLK